MLWGPGEWAESRTGKQAALAAGEMAGKGQIHNQEFLTHQKEKDDSVLTNSENNPTVSDCQGSLTHLAPNDMYAK